MGAGSRTSSNMPEHSTIGAEEIRLALEGVIGSETFARADRARSLLSYLVRAEQNGEAARLKGFTIAQDVFGRDDDFDPAMDAVVRVQAGRLRDHLASFYAGEGKDELIEISVPKGTYVPTYLRRGIGPDERTGAIASLPANADRSAGEPAAPRIVDFGRGASGFTLDVEVPGKPLAATRMLSGADEPSSHDAMLGPFIVRNIKRFWMAVAIIMLLLTVILVLVWRS